MKKLFLSFLRENSNHSRYHRMVDFLEQHFTDLSIHRDHELSSRNERFEGSFIHDRQKLSMTIIFCESVSDNRILNSMTITINQEILYSHTLTCSEKEKITINNELASKLKIWCVKSATTETLLPTFIFETPVSTVHMRCNKYYSFDWFREYLLY
jgi:hypothetical protein